MIRRDFPRIDDPPQWLLISQIEHARISHQLAAAWRELLPSAPKAVREELLAAILHHDDGWQEWREAPKIDPEHGRPYGFTEMPPGEAQTIWTRSIDACRELGPLAGWCVASHFIALQDKQDDDYAEWESWIRAQEERSAVWLAIWLASDPGHTQPIANQCLYRLQQFDWLSLWFCCRAPIDPRDPAESLTLGDAKQSFGPYTFTPSGKELTLAPWPFARPSLDVIADAALAAPGVYDATDQMRTKPTRATWRLIAS